MEYLQIAECLEEMRQRCCQLDCDLKKTKQQLCQSKSECSVLKMKLKHARNQVEVEMKKRHWAEAELEKQECKLQLIYKYLTEDPQIIPLTEDQHTDLATVEKLRFNHSSPLPRKHTDESGGQNSHVGRKAIGPTSGGTIGAFTHSSGMPPLQQHQFASKMVIRLDWCVVCKSRLCFGRMALKCRSCQLLVHPECKEHCPSQCVPGAHSRVKEGILADFAPSKPPRVPPIVVLCVVQTEKRGLREAGLYRVPGAEPLVREWKYKLLSSQEALPSLDLVADVHVICGILKDFLRNLKEPLVTFCLHSAFLQAAEILDESACHTELCHVVMKLPATNRDTLAFLMLHLHRVTQSPDCRMDRHNLARIFGPLLVGHSTPSPSPLAIMEDTPRQCLVISRLLALPLKFWKHFIEEQENLVPSLQQSIVMNQQDQLFHLLIPPEANTVQMSPGNGCFPNKLHNCIGTTLPPLNVPHAKKMGRFLPLPK
ncbi:rac GTPase-activating protein 1-like [Vipera latastei]